MKAKSVADLPHTQPCTFHSVSSVSQQKPCFKRTGKATCTARAHREVVFGYATM